MGVSWGVVEILGKGISRERWREVGCFWGDSVSDLRREVKRYQARGISPRGQLFRRKQPLTESYGLFKTKVVKGL